MQPVAMVRNFTLLKSALRIHQLDLFTASTEGVKPHGVQLGHLKATKSSVQALEGQKIREGRDAPAVNPTVPGSSWSLEIFLWLAKSHHAAIGSRYLA